MLLFARFPSCARYDKTLTVRRVMGFFLRRAGFGLATGLIIFCCSCERHHVGELPQHSTKGAESHSADSHASPAPEARMSPANFFPEKTKP